MSTTTAAVAPPLLRPYRVFTVVGGLGIIAAGLTAALDVAVADSLWFGFSGVTALLVVIGVLGLRRLIADVRVAVIALTAVAVTMSLFGLVHFWAIADPDAALPLAGAFMMLSAAGLVVAAVALRRSDRRSGPLWWLLLATGLWPLSIPIGLALGDATHFGAITLWGAWWTALGSAVRR